MLPSAGQLVKYLYRPVGNRISVPPTSCCNIPCSPLINFPPCFFTGIKIQSDGVIRCLMCGIPPIHHRRTTFHHNRPEDGAVFCVFKRSDTLQWHKRRGVSLLLWSQVGWRIKRAKLNLRAVTSVAFILLSSICRQLFLFFTADPVSLIIWNSGSHREESLLLFFKVVMLKGSRLP